MSYKHDFIKQCLKEQPANRKELQALLRTFLKIEKVSPPNNASLLKAYRELLASKEITVQPWLELLLLKRAVRTLSGVAPVHVMTAPLGCPARCIYCPNEPGMPKSYLSNQPGSMRAILNDFDPYKQVTMRLRALYQNGHHPEKIELIENGGTWGALPLRYRIWFMTRCFQAANDFDPKLHEQSADFAPPDKSHLRVLNRLKNQPDHLAKETLRLHDDDADDLMIELAAAQKINETARYRMIGVTLETRPDWLSDEEIAHLRQVGCTKVELGVQNIFEEVLRANGRGHGLETVIDATTRLRDAGFKVAYHIMPGMYKSTPEKDVEMFKQLFSDPGLKPDFLKIYPCVVVKEAPLYKLWERGDYVPYYADTLLEVLISVYNQVDRYCRVARLVRDIPSSSISDGNKITNLREVVEKEMVKRGIAPKDIRAREIMGEVQDVELTNHDQKFETVNGTEHFLSYDSPDDKLYAFLRLRLPEKDSTLIKTTLPELAGAALVRELHTYGKLARLETGQFDSADSPSDSAPANSPEDSKKAQHKGLGKKLMEQAEEIAKEAGFSKIAVIAGIGTREYYKKLGYVLEGTYMVKGL